MASPRRCRLEEVKGSSCDTDVGCTLKDTGDTSSRVLYPRVKPPHAVRESIGLLITMSDACGCVNLPDGGGGGELGPHCSTGTSAQRHTCSHPPSYDGAAFRGKKLHAVFDIVWRLKALNYIVRFEV